VLTAAADRLRPADLGAVEDLDDATATALTEVMAEIGKLYTMARERQIHAAYVPAASAN
jgi:hypothetical protein